VETKDDSFLQSVQAVLDPPSLLVNWYWGFFPQEYCGWGKVLTT